MRRVLHDDPVQAAVTVLFGQEVRLRIGASLVALAIIVAAIVVSKRRHVDMGAGGGTAGDGEAAPAGAASA